MMHHLPLRMALQWIGVLLLVAGCAGPVQENEAVSPGALNVLAAETFLADIAQNVAGDRVRVDALIPQGVDPHGFEPTPQDIRRVAESDVLIINGAGFETFLGILLSNAGGERLMIEAAAGLTSRTAREGESAMGVGEDAGATGHSEGDPHFWLDPNHAVKYVENIRDGLTQADSDGSTTYAANARAYVAKLQELDKWIVAQVQDIPVERRLLVTNHESFGYFADRYGFRIVGTVIPSISTSASPSAQQLATLVDVMKTSGAPAIFLETGASAQLADQIALETGAKVVTGLLTHSVTQPDGPAPDYIGMMRYNVRSIVDALK